MSTDLPLSPETAAPVAPSPASRFVPVISIIAPTFNERENIRPLVEAIGKAMGHVAWELIIVDDDSPDGTAEEALVLAREGLPVRCIRRIGRRGLASAVVEGALASNAEYIAVIDADMQHDESILPKMLEVLSTTETDLVIGSRHIEGGGLGDWSATRQKMSRLATWCATKVIGSQVADPMSGFFAIKRDLFHACVYDLSQQGYKILLDILTSSPRPLKVVELPYVFRTRTRGESKMDAIVIGEFLFLLIDKLTDGLIPPKFVLFSIIGGIGLGLHLAVLSALRLMDSNFLPAQLVATYSAMTLNYVMNNSITYRSQRLRGLQFYTGYFIFVLVCSIGSLANIGVAELMLADYESWALAGAVGALMSAVFNFSGTSQLVWRQRRRPQRPIIQTSTPLRVLAG
jgi:dolichol-phosphate mannosyltransferase